MACYCCGAVGAFRRTTYGEKNPKFCEQTTTADKTNKNTAASL